MSWLHTWCGLVCGWLLCAIFLTGSISVFREPVTLWMQAVPLEGSRQQPLSLNERLQALRLAEQHLSKTAPDAGIWRIGLPLQTGEGVKVFARSLDGKVQASLHALTGQVLPEPALRQTEGGRHFMSFHYSLQGGIAGFWVVGLVSMCMMVALVSGVIVHRRIFQDFFTFRPGKGQRSWLDAHNASAVLTLPFLFMIVYTGLAHFYTSYMPWPLQSLYGQERSAYSRYESELKARPEVKAAPDAPAIAGADLVGLAQQAQSCWRSLWWRCWCSDPSTVGPRCVSWKASRIRRRRAKWSMSPIRRPSMPSTASCCSCPPTRRPVVLQAIPIPSSARCIWSPLVAGR